MRSARIPSGIGPSGAGYRNPQERNSIALFGRRRWTVYRGHEGKCRQPPAIPSRVLSGSTINNGPNLPADPKVVEFLRYVLSREGQEQVLREGDFLPLTASVAQGELKNCPEVAGCRSGGEAPRGRARQDLSSAPRPAPAWGRMPGGADEAAQVPLREPLCQDPRSPAGLTGNAEFSFASGPR